MRRKKKTTFTRRLWPAAALAIAAGCGGGEQDRALASISESVDGEGGLVAPQAIDTAELKAAISGERMRLFYEDRDWKPAWTNETARDLVETLKNAGRHGLDPADYAGAVDTAGRGPAAREAALTRAAFALADALADGKADPTELFAVYTLDRPRVDVAAGLGVAVIEGRASEWIESLAPSDEDYRALSEAYLRHAREAARRSDSTIAEGDLIREGDSDPRVPQIVEVLEANGYLERGEARARDGSDAAIAGSDSDSRDRTPAERENRYTTRIADAVERLQSDFGISDDGIVGPETLKMLNTGSEERARLLAVNLERRRWLERDTPITRVDVNIADATLDYFRDGALRDSRAVVVGQPGWETPQLGSPIFRLVANPTWTVPKSIERQEIEPKGEGYLARNNMVRRDGWIVQLPGPENALGVVKFDMKNDQAIYLHDTPAVSLFDRTGRHFSHGCIRVDNAPQFARMLAREAGVMPTFRQARASGSESFVDLPQQIPVRLLYRTAYVGEDGSMEYRTDPYGWDNRVAEALGYEPREAPRKQTVIETVGP